MSDQKTLLRGVKKLAQAGVRIEKEGVVLYVDPYGLLTDSADADYVFLTHGHSDHFSPNDIRHVLKQGTVFICPPDTAEKVAAEFEGAKIKQVVPGDMLSLGGLGVDVLAAYNTDKKFHPKENGWVGYIIRSDDASYYLPGDTDVTEEFLSAQADVFFVPIGGTYTMDVEQAAEAINRVKPKLAVPFHYGDLPGVGVREDGARFLSLLSGVDGLVL